VRKPLGHGGRNDEGIRSPRPNCILGAGLRVIATDPPDHLQACVNKL
jgi:hypothetical protein